MKEPRIRVLLKLKLLENFIVKAGQSVQFIKTKLQNKQTNRMSMFGSHDMEWPIRRFKISVVANRVDAAEFDKYWLGTWAILRIE